MKQFLLLFSLALLLSACAGNDVEKTQQNTAHANEQTIPDTTAPAAIQTLPAERVKEDEETSTIPYSKDRKLRYLYTSNAGLLGFFSDSTVSSCERCDLCQGNIRALYRNEPYATFIAEETFLYFIRDGAKSKMELTTAEGDLDRWAMLNYEWQEELPDCGAE